jgi:hypothetical protein
VLRVGPDLFDTVQRQATNIVDENSVALRLDYRINQKHSTYFRFFRDQGTNDQPEGVTGRRVLIRRYSPKRCDWEFSPFLTPTVLNEFKVGYNGALSRINGVAPSFPGIDLSTLSLNIAGSVAALCPSWTRSKCRRSPPPADWSVLTARPTDGHNPTLHTRSPSSTI